MQNKKLCSLDIKLKIDNISLLYIKLLWLLFDKEFFKVLKLERMFATNFILFLLMVDIKFLLKLGMDFTAYL